VLTSDRDRSNEARLSELFRAAESSCAKGVSTSDFEPSFDRLLEFILDHPECWASAELRFIGGLSDGKAGWELIASCMHTLRMPSVRNEAARLLGVARDPRASQTLARILASFEDGWAASVRRPS
jgi:hypothetical protein